MRKHRNPTEISQEILELAQQADLELRKGRWTDDIQEAFQTSGLFKKIIRAAQEAAEETELQSEGFPTLTVGELWEILDRMDPNLSVTFPDGSVPEPHLVAHQGYHGHVALPAWNRTHTSASQLGWSLRKAVENGSTRRGRRGDNFRIQASAPIWAQGQGVNRETRLAITSIELGKDSVVLLTKPVGPEQE